MGIDFTEAQLEKELSKHLSNQNFDFLAECGFDFYDEGLEDRWFTVDTQVHLPPYGIADIIVTHTDVWAEGPPDDMFLDGTMCGDLIELKATPLKTKDFEQVLRYKTAIERYQRLKYEEDSKYAYGIEVSPILIGNGFDSGHFLHNELKDMLWVYTYETSLMDGITFKYQGGSWFKNEDDNEIAIMDNHLRYLEVCEYIENYSKEGRVNGI